MSLFDCFKLKYSIVLIDEKYYGVKVKSLFREYIYSARQDITYSLKDKRGIRLWGTFKTVEEAVKRMEFLQQPKKKFIQDLKL